MGGGRLEVGDGRREVEGRWEVKRWQMGDGRWEMGGERWEMEDGR